MTQSVDIYEALDRIKTRQKQDAPTVAPKPETASFAVPWWWAIQGDRVRVTVETKEDGREIDSVTFTLVGERYALEHPGCLEGK